MQSINDVLIKKIKACVHERIAKRMKFECRDGPVEDRYKTANKNVNRLTFVFERQQIHDGNKK